MLDKLLNFYTKYPWIAIIILVHWLATAATIYYTQGSDISLIMGMSFLSTVIYSYFGFQVPKA